MQWYSGSSGAMISSPLDSMASAGVSNRMKRLISGSPAFWHRECGSVYVGESADCTGDLGHRREVDHLVTGHRQDHRFPLPGEIDLLETDPLRPLLERVPCKEILSQETMLELGCHRKRGQEFLAGVDLGSMSQLEFTGPER